MSSGHYRRNSGKTTLHHVCGHQTVNFTLDCFTIGRVAQLEAGPCLNCRMLRLNTEKVPVVALVAGQLIDGRFVEANFRLIDSPGVQFHPSPKAGEVFIIIPKAFPFVLASRHEIEGVAVYQVLYRPKSQQKGKS